MRERPLSVLVAGASGMILEVPAGSFPPSDGMHRTLSHSLSPRPWGQGAEMAVAVSRQQGRALLCSAVGSDGLGAALCAYLRGEGVDTRFVSARPHGATTLTVAFTEEGESQRDATYLGVGEDSVSDSLAEGIGCLPDACLLSSALSAATLRGAADRCRDRRIPCFVNGVGADPIALKGLPPLDTLMVGAEECSLLTGLSPFGVEEAMTCALSLSRLIPATYHLIWLGDRGSYLYDGRLARFFPAHSSQRTLSCAASAYGVAFLMARLRGADPRAACKVAAIASALASGGRADLTVLPTSSELAAALRSSYSI